MTATAIIREIYKMNDDYILKTKKQTDDDKETALNKYYRSYNNFMPYQYSIWTTAHSRDFLFRMIEASGDNDGIDDYINDVHDLTDTYKNFLYCDTDSIFYIKTKLNEPRLAEFASYCRTLAKDKNMFVDDKYLGEPTDEPPIRAFRAIHSKCYAMEELDDESGEYKLIVVIAGIPKCATKWENGKPIKKTNAEELGSIDNLVDGFKFSHCGGTRCVYVERPISVMNINGHLTEIASSAVIENIDKEISDTMYTKGADYSVLKIVQDAI